MQKKEEPLAIQNWDEFMEDTEEICVLFRKIVSKYKLNKGSLTTGWDNSGNLCLAINLPEIRGID